MDNDDPAPTKRPTRPAGPRPPKHSPNPAHADAAIQVPSTPTQKTPTTTFIPPPPLTPPPPISFESTPIPWKGLPLDAAQCTFSSSELQEIVSQAIRLSARESFVRLLSPQALEVDLVHEADRLDESRLEAQAKWRFECGRRTMLMQALNASAAFSAPSDFQGTEAANPMPGFVAQLASAIATCDALLSTILSIADQQSQIALVQHQHWASALGMALRKLNKAHERQGQELKRAQARVQTLEDELEEAWREAEKMAIEFDDLEEEIAESDSEVIESPQEDIPNPRLGLDLKHDFDETGTLGDVTIHTDIGVVLGVTATAVVSKATLVTSPKLPVDKSDTKSIRSTRSRRSTRDGQSHLSRLSSARMRSRAASNASLRLPKTLRSAPSTHSSPVDAPPIPTLPTVQPDSFLDMDNEHLRKVFPPKPHPEPKLSLPTPPHSAGLPPTRVPSIWLETDAGKSTHLSALDRSHSLQIFSSLSPRKMRRSNLVMSLSGSEHSLSASLEGSNASNDHPVGTGTGTASPTSTHSPVSLPTHALAHFRGPSLSSSSHSMGIVSAGVGRPGSAGARLTTPRESERGTPLPTATPRKSLVSRASSVILRRLSQATTMGGHRVRTVPGRGGVGSPSRTTRLNGRERWKDRAREDMGIGEVEGEGEVMLIGSPHAEVLDTDTP
ncbi:hypothetical protein OG21DRAFT_848600 [Imleria badia]|nr:hypothetical protein OG21DRAFT_848600 [Imleria badia]